MKPIENIEKDPHIQMFLQTRNMKPRTIELRLLQIKDYCKHHNMTPTQIIEEAEEDEDQQIKMKHRKIRKRLITYINHKINNEESPATILSRITSITLLYKTFEIQIPQLPRPHHDKEDYNIQNIPTKEDIQKALSYCNIQYQAIIKLMATNGIMTF